MSAGRIRVLLADDHPLVREGIRSALSREPGIKVVGEAADGEEALRLARSLRPDVALLDIHMPKMTGLEAAKALRRRLPELRSIILSVDEDPAYVRRAVAHGARGYVLKDARPKELVAAIRDVRYGGTYFSPSVSKALLRDVVEGSGRLRGDELGELTPREKQVLALIADGLSSKEAARRLGLSARTIDTHRERIMDKLDIHNVAGLTKYAIAKGLIRL